MPTYRLVFKEDGLGVDKHIEFEGKTPSCALDILSDEKDARRAELWEKGKNLAELVRDRWGVWQVNFSRPSEKPK